jgi:hypothetical protein
LKRFAVVVLVAVVALVTACGSDDDEASSSARFTFLGFSDHTGADNHAPPDVTKPGGTLRACNPANLYAFVSFTGLEPPKEFAGSWTLNGNSIGLQSFSQTERQAETFWQLRNTPTPLSAGTYRFELEVDGKPASQGSFTLTC